MAPRDAMREAEERGLDLVEVAPKAAPPVCRIMDYGKYKYEQKRRARESRKHQHTVSVKEVKVRPKIDPHDLLHKSEHAREFLIDGNKVKVTVMFRGREMAHPEFGKELLHKMIEITKDIATSDTNPDQVGSRGATCVLILTPFKTAPWHRRSSGGDGHADSPPVAAATRAHSAKG
jgi:translation initiation factor IF-3